jgi:hypothetical protein
MDSSVSPAFPALWQPGCLPRPERNHTPLPAPRSVAVTSPPRRSSPSGGWRRHRIRYRRGSTPKREPDRASSGPHDREDWRRAPPACRPALSGKSASSTRYSMPLARRTSGWVTASIVGLQFTGSMLLVSTVWLWRRVSRVLDIMA